MSFTPSKKPHQSPPSLSHRSKSHHHFYDLAQNYSHFGSRPSLDADPSYRLDILNSNIIRINQQQEALLPLIDHLDIPEMRNCLENNEYLTREMLSKNQEMDERMERLEELIQNYGLKIENRRTVKVEREEPIIERIDKSPRAEVRLLEKGVKKIVMKITQNDDILASVEKGMQKIQKTIEDKLESETNTRSTKVEKRIERNMKEFNMTVEDVNKGVEVGFERLEKAVEDLYQKVSL